MSTLAVTPGSGDQLLTESMTDGTLGTGKIGFTKTVYGAAGTTQIVDATHGFPIQGQGSAGTPAGGVMSVQGVTSMTALKVDGSGVTQPISGSLTLTAVATGGATPGKLVSAATTNATSIKGSAGTVYTINAGNTNASPRFLKLYNKASAPTVGSDTPVQIFLIPGNTAGAGTNIPIPACGINFSTGIAFALTTGMADADTGAVGAAEVCVCYSYL